MITVVKFGNITFKRSLQATEAHKSDKATAGDRMKYLKMYFFDPLKPNTLLYCLRRCSNDLFAMADDLPNVSLYVSRRIFREAFKTFFGITAKHPNLANCAYALLAL